MKSFFSMFKTSAKEFKSIRSMAITGSFIAVSMLIESFSIDIGYTKLNFAFVAIAVIGMLFGPAVSVFAGFACDLVGFMVHPTGGFFPAFTLVAGLQGLIYGVCLYHKFSVHSIRVKGKDITMYVRMVTARSLDVVIINLFINTALLLHYGFIPKAAYSSAVVARAAKNALELAVDLPLMFIVLPVCLAAYKRTVRSSAGAN